MFYPPGARLHKQDRLPARGQREAFFRTRSALSQGEGRLNELYFLND
jgi:hypothetical protein